MKDKYNATWVSYSSISDWLRCPRAYYFKNVYKNPKTGRKISLMAPPLALGQAVHEVIEGLSTLAVDKRFDTPLVTRLEQAWKKISGKRGGFSDRDQEARFLDRAKVMLKRVNDHPGPLKNLAVKIKTEGGMTPYFWLSEADEIILVGRIDWLEYLADKEAVHIIDFKTGKTKQKDGSLQLPIYLLLAENLQERPVKKVSYWYIEQSNAPEEQKMPVKEKAEQDVLKVAKEISLAKKLNRFVCPHGGCPACREMEAVTEGKAEMGGVDEIGREVYVLEHGKAAFESELL